MSGRGGPGGEPSPPGLPHPAGPPGASGSVPTTTAAALPGPAAVVAFWREAGAGRWFRKDSAFDDDFRARFLDAHHAAARGELQHWSDTAEGSLALLILLDQFPRNAFRGTAHMYATDPLARQVARQMIARGQHLEVEPALRLFCCLPFAHSESLEDQALSVSLHRPLGEEALKHAQEHHDIVRRFGRFPHRNPMLARETTPDEAAFLAGGGFKG